MKRITLLSAVVGLFFATTSMNPAMAQHGHHGNHHPGFSARSPFGSQSPQRHPGQFSGGFSGRSRSASGSFSPRHMGISARQGNQSGFIQGQFNGRQSAISGGVSNKNGTTTMNWGRSGGGFHQKGADGSSRGANIHGNWNRFNGQAQNFDSSGNGYRGGLSRDGNRVGINGEYRTPGSLPGTQNRWKGNVDLNGRNTRIGGGYEMYDATGRVRLSQVNGTLDRRQLSTQQSMGVGGVGMKQNWNVKFGGKNTNISASRELNAGGLASQKLAGSINKEGIKASGAMSVGGARVEAKANVSTHGTSIKVGGVKLSF